MGVSLGYKHTDAGVIPEDWQVDALGPHVDITSGESPSSFSFFGEGTPYFKVEQLNNNSKFLSDTPYFIRSSRKVARGSLIFPKRGASILLNKIRLLADDSFMDTNLMALTTHESVHSEFLYYALTHIELWRIADITSIPQINNKHIVPLLVPVPGSRHEQEVIAEALSDADALIESLEQLLAKKRQIKQGAMQELLTGKTRLPGFNAAWESSRLGELGHTYGGLTGKSKQDFGHGAARFITFMNVMSNVVIDCDAFDFVDVRSGESQNRAVKGDLFFNGSSETPEEVGMCAYLDADVQDVYLNSFCFGFRVHGDASVDRLYLAYYFRSSQGRELLKSLAQGATRYNLSKTALLRVEFPLPLIDEQKAIARVLSDMDTELASLETKLIKARQLKQGMMQELLTGRIRLV